MKIHKNFTKKTFSYAIILLILRMILGNTAQSLCGVAFIRKMLPKKRFLLLYPISAGLSIFYRNFAESVTLTTVSRRKLQLQTCP